jgi:hypothetical protein
MGLLVAGGRLRQLKRTREDALDFLLLNDLV